MEVGIDKDPELPQEKERLDQGLDPVPMLVQIEDRSRCYRCNEYDHFARECPNIMSDEEQVENLQMLLPEEQTEVLNYSGRV